MKVRNLLTLSALLAAASPLAFGAPRAPTTPAYACDACTNAELIDGARSLGDGRHVLVDLHSDAPHAFEVAGSTVTGVTATAEEMHRFALAKRVWGEGDQPAHVERAELAAWLDYANINPPAAEVLVTGAYRNDMADVLEALLPALLPRDVPGAFRRICQRCAGGPVKSPPSGRRIDVELEDGGSVEFSMGSSALLRARVVRDASGDAWKLDEAGGIVAN